MSAANRPWPVELKVRRRDAVLSAAFDDGHSFDLSAEYLRVMTPSAADRGHGGGPGRCVDGKRGVGVTDVQPVGRYAVRIRFDDGHDTGLYSWDELYRLGRDHNRLWAEYLQRLEREGLSR
ncbi:MAG TPA: DUF971 domain-containing protein [Caulobacteraceae bacterium]|jgi:DUF971 family protein